ncbi:CrcB protein [Lysobacter sp. yr284]|nr:CrcB protein [Lysobacter sp. yr284]
MDGMSAVSIFIGAGLGALLRWWLGLALNPLFPTLPMGTLAANVLGGLLMGLSMAVFAQYETLPLALRLALTTGFLGGLTTFSTFSAETSSLLLRGEYGWAGAIVAAHVGASLLATLAGAVAMRGALRWLAA